MIHTRSKPPKFCVYSTVELIAGLSGAPRLRGAVFKSGFLEGAGDASLKGHRLDRGSDFGDLLKSRKWTLLLDKTSSEDSIRHPTVDIRPGQPLHKPTSASHVHWPSGNASTRPRFNAFSMLQIEKK